MLTGSKVDGFRLSAAKLSTVAMLLWLASLALPSIAIYAKQDHKLGAEILAIGWLSPLVWNFAWFANPLLLWSFFRLRTGKSASGSMLIAALLSLDTLRFSSYLTDEGGGHSAVYGYGWGVVLWYCALFMMMAAAGASRIETRLQTGGDEMLDEKLRPLGLFLCAIALLASASMSVHDKGRANNAERGRLSGLAFKRGPVCAEVASLLSQPVNPGLNAIQLTIAQGQYASTAYPFNELERLLAWGIPVIRFGDRDYSYSSTQGDKILTSVPAAGPVAAELLVAHSATDDGTQISARLVERPTHRTVFDQTWRKEANGSVSCPEYSTFPKPEEQPRKLVTQALSVQTALTDDDRNVDRSDPRENWVKAEIVSNIGTLDSSAQGAQEPALPVSKDALRKLLWQANRNCPDDVGWDGKLGTAEIGRLSAGWPFRVHERAFYPGTREQHNALCAGEHVYLYQGFARDDKYLLMLQKRRLSDFYQVWSGTVEIQDRYLATGNDVLKLDALEESEEGVTIHLTKEQTGRTAVIKAPLMLSR